MITKVYAARYSDYTTYVTVNGVDVKVRFEESFTNGLSRLSTTNKDLQEAIECRPDFGSVIVLQKVLGKEDKVVEEPKKVEVKSYPEANTVQKAAHILISEYDIPSSKVRVASQVKSIANSLNIEFPNLV